MHAHMCMHVYTHLHLHMCMYTYAHTCTYTYVHTCTHTYTYTHTHTASHTLSSPGAGYTWSLTFVQETCHIEGIFKKELKESTELCVSDITAVCLLPWAAVRDEQEGCLSLPLTPEGRAC